MEVESSARTTPRPDRYTQYLNGSRTTNSRCIPEHLFRSRWSTPRDPAASSMDEGESSLPGADSVIRDFLCYAPNCAEAFRSQRECESHYNSKHRFICSICKKSFTSSHLLELHVTESHDAFFSVMAKRRNMYECFVESCKQKFANEDDRFNHCIEEHKDKRPFYFPRSKSLNQASTSKAAVQQCGSASTSNSMETDVVPNISDDLMYQRKPLGKRTNKAAHFCFGAKAGKFIPRQTFALAKKPPKSKSIDAKVDLTEMMDALSEFSSPSQIEASDCDILVSVNHPTTLVDSVDSATLPSPVPASLDLTQDSPTAEARMQEIDVSAAVPEKRKFQDDGTGKGDPDVKKPKVE